MGGMNCKEYRTSSKNNKVSDFNGCTENYTSKCADDEDYVEKIVCDEGDIQNDEMKQFEIGDDQKILLIKQKNELSAIGTKCSHYGAPLHTGTLGDERVRCPWHGACFNIKTGDIEDFPGLDSIPCYKVKIEEGKIKIRARKQDLEQNKRIKDMVKKDPNNDEVFVIIGGGPAGGVCSEVLRQEGFKGRIVMICKENALPYDRVKLSKAMNVELKSIEFRKQPFYDEYSIETKLGVEATKLDAFEKTLTLSNGYEIKFDKAFIATGAKAMKPPIPGADLENVITIRDHDDVQSVHNDMTEEKNVVCLGSSFIGLEAAAYFVNKVKQVTLIGRDDLPLKASFGKEIGERVLKLFEDNNVKMLMSSGIKQCLGENGKITSVELIDGQTIPCDLLVMGTGSRFYTDFLKNSGIALNENGSVEVDIHLMTNVPNIYAGGDIANAPVFSSNNEKGTIGHYQLAQYHGKIAAANMCSKLTELRAIPFFWTMFFGKGLRYAGYGKPTEVRIEGSLEEMKFVVFHMNDSGEVIAVASCGRDPVVAQYKELRSQGKCLHKNDLIGDPFQWTEKLKQN